jgi:hypothetical protein
MRYSWLPLVFVAFATLTSAAAPPKGENLAERRADRGEVMLRLRQLDRQIQRADAQAKSLERLLAEYQSFQKFSIGNPLTLTVEETKLQLLDAKLLAEELREERSQLSRYGQEGRSNEGASIRATIRIRE